MNLSLLAVELGGTVATGNRAAKILSNLHRREGKNIRKANL
jgi:hypothetical protein